LDDGVRVVPRAVRFPPGNQSDITQARIGIGVAFHHQQLAGISARLRHDGSSLEPQEPGTPMGESLVATDGQRIRAAVGSSVTALHGVDGQRVGRLLAADAHTARQRAEIHIQGQVEPERADLGAQVIEGLEAKAFVGHMVLPLSVWANADPPGPK